jgi:ABC transporter with metal-binding/Fe-S-binding domain ATP-binding protein
MNVAVLISGGKDSALALHRVLKKGYNVKYLVTMVPLNKDSWMFHHQNVRLTDLFSKAVGISLVKRETEGIKEEELKDLENLLMPLNVDGIVSGAVFSEYQKVRIDRICKKLGFKSITPLWNENPVNIINELIKLDFQAVITGVYALGFNQDWLGRIINYNTLKALIHLKRKYEVSIIGEGGEYESLIIDAPYFRKKIQIIRARKIWEGNSGYLLVEEARLQKKL